MDDRIDEETRATLSRREFVVAGGTSLLSLDTSTRRQVGEPNSDDEYQFRGVADLLGPREARPEPGDPFFEDKLAYAYRYEATDTGARFFKTEDDDTWQSLTMFPETQVDEVRVEDYTTFYDHTFSRPDQPDTKNWNFTPDDVTKVGTEIELASTTTLETTQHGNYAPGTEAIAGAAFRVTDTPTGGEALCGYFNDENGFGFGADATDSFLFIRKSGTTLRIYREDWNDYSPDSRIFVSKHPVVVRNPHLFYGGGGIRFRFIEHANNESVLRNVHTITPDNLPDSWGDGPPFDQPNLPSRFESDGLTGSSLRANATHYERGNSGAETRVNGETFSGVSAPVDDWTPLMNIRKRSGWEMANIRPLNIAVESANSDAKIELQLDPTLDGTQTWELPENTSSSETSIEVTRDGNQGGITTDGERRYIDYAPAGQGNQSGQVTTSELDLSMPNGQVLTLAAQGIGGTATISGAITVQEFF